MASSRIALAAMIALLAATAAFSQDTQKEPPAQSSASDSSQSNAPKPIPVRVPGNVASAMLIHQVAPVYAAAPQTPVGASPEPNSSTPRPKSIRVGGNVAAANLVHQVTPIYPKDAKKHHIQGAVVLHAIIAQDGTMKTVEYVSGPAELTDSAIEAVKEWRYKPTLLNGEPVEVDTTISVIYTLGNH